MRYACKSIFKLVATLARRKCIAFSILSMALRRQREHAERRLGQLTLALNWRKSIFLILLNVPFVETAAVIVATITTTTVAAAVAETPVA